MFEITWQEVERQEPDWRTSASPGCWQQDGGRPGSGLEISGLELSGRQVIGQGSGRQDGGRPGPGRLAAERARLRPALDAPALQMPTAATPAPGLEIPRAVAPPLVLGTRLVSIRVPFKSAVVSCAICSKAFSAHGPTGYREEQPICDRCLLDQENQLGMLLAVSIFTRAYAVLADKEEPIASEAAVEMLAFARIYELFAARFGPARPLDFSAISAAGTIG